MNEFRGFVKNLYRLPMDLISQFSLLMKKESDAEGKTFKEYGYQGAQSDLTNLKSFGDL